jgi:L-asparaginase
VDIIFACADMSADLIDASVENGAKGIVIAGVGNGNMNKASLEAAARASRKSVVVVRSSRVATGTVDAM